MRLWLAIVLFAPVAFAQTEREFTRTIAQGVGSGTTCVTWSNRAFTYRVDQAGSSATPGDTEFDAINSAFSTWQALSSSCSDFSFTPGARIAKPQVGKGSDDSNIITFRETSCRDVVPNSHPCLADNNCGNVFSCWDHSDLTIGLTTTTYSTRTGVALDSDIELNASPHGDGTKFLFTTIATPACDEGREAPTCAASDIQNTVTHEIGHVVGFDHVSNPASTMAPTAPLGETRKRVIDLGTGDGFCLTYPRAKPPLPCDEVAQQRLRIVAWASSCTSVGDAPFALSLLALMSAWLRRRTMR